ncbi:MAG TPA: 2Fe-2S iron-sulfur cluster binding domain-containing protein [Alicyclobacillus sp.]|nr:2Fe-2S iron-sulfur cluster binding domain-containing protein [Alicyclobacillus sp.]
MFNVEIVDSFYEKEKPFFSCTNQQSLLDATRLQGVRIKYACKVGGCGLCKIKVVEGEYRRGTCSVSGLPYDERLQNYTLACKTYPTSDMKILIQISSGGGDRHEQNKTAISHL